MLNLKEYLVPKMWNDGIVTDIILLTDSETEITDDPATEPAQAPGRNDLPENNSSVWGDLW